MNLDKIDPKEVSIHKGVAETDDFKTGFTDNWPLAKGTLEVLKTVIKNPFVRWIIVIVIGVGDTVYEELT
jgi:hypothetical protein